MSVYSLTVGVWCKELCTAGMPVLASPCDKQFRLYIARPLVRGLADMPGVDLSIDACVGHWQLVFCSLFGYKHSKTLDTDSENGPVMSACGLNVTSPTLGITSLLFIIYFNSSFVHFPWIWFSRKVFLRGTLNFLFKDFFGELAVIFGQVFWSGKRWLE